ncbi:hypothetical protein CEUSTIGMA_g8980.t1 [Chlamydomonas eustigma]|uniref:Guanylate cyclase domain-containing protein n=1 Tax=Chlamydomonas eustigma TaxID=1157962 RepID=A0A250XF67_9CHLO|nr:hypothetical protein CEUSTIGMA_g8980.t1 [Chlamydomonas eustigma]|eukprot:GAX81552.1 hypothetical protein CEUSTIGMA_g8980.t1 [Chlamydomonas eustigma]
MLCLPCFNSGRRKAKLQNLDEKTEDHFARQLSPLFQTQEQSQQSQARALNLQYLHHNNDTLLQNAVFLRFVASSINDASLFMLSEDVCPGLLLLDGVLGPVAVISTADLQAIENRRPASSSWAPLFFEISENIQARSEDAPQPLTLQQKSSFLMTLAADACSDEQLRVLLMCAAFSLLANKYFIHEHVLKPPSHHVGKALSSNGYLQSPKIFIKTCVFGNVEKEDNADKTSAANPEMVPKYDGPSHHSKGPYYANASYAPTISSTIRPAYTFLLEHMPALVTLLNSEGLIVYQNPASAQYYSGLLGDVNVAPEHAQVDHLLDQWCQQSHAPPGASALSAAPLGVTALLRRGGILRRLLSVETSKETVSDLLGHIFGPPPTAAGHITEWRGMLKVCGADAEQGGEQGASFSWNAVQPDGRDGGMEQAHESPSLNKGEEQGLESTESEVAPLAEVQGIGSVAHDSHNDDSHYGLSGTSADLGSVMRLGASSSLRSRGESFVVEGVRDLEPGSHMTDDPDLRIFRKVGRSTARSSTFSIRQVSQFSPEPFSPNMEGSGGEDQGSSWAYRQLGIKISSRGGLDLEEEGVSESFQALRASSALSSMKQYSSGASSFIRKGGSRLNKFHRTMQLLATAESSRMLKTAVSSKARCVSSGRSRGSKQNSQEVLLSTFSTMAGHSYLISSPPSEENSLDQLEGELLKGPGRVRRVGYHRSIDNNLISKSEKLPSRQLRFERTSSVFDRSLFTNIGEDLNPLIMESLQMEEPMTAQDLEPRTHSSQVLSSLWPSNALPMQVDSSTLLDAARPSGSATEAEGMEVAAQYLPSFPPNRHTASGAMTVYRRNSDLLKKQQLNEQEGEKRSFSTMLSDKARSGGRTMQRAQSVSAESERVEEGMMGGDASQVQLQGLEGLHPGPAAPNFGKSGRVAPSSSFSSEPLLILTQVSEDHLQHMPSANSQKGMPSLQDVKRERTVGVSEAVDSGGPGSVESWRKLQLALRQQKEQFDLQSPANVGGQHGAGNASKSDMREEDRDDKVGHDVGKADLQEGIASNQKGIPPQIAPGGEQLLPGVAAGSSLVGDSWHDVVIRWVKNTDTVSSSGATGESTHMLLIVQMDVTEQIQMQETLAAMSEGQLSLLSSIFPRHVVETLSLNDLSHLSSHFGSLAKLHKNVSILFLDIVGFTVMSNSVSPSAILVFLNRLFTMFDVLADKHNVQKVDTAGDCYIASAGITGSDEGGGFFHARSSDEKEDDEQNTINYTLRMLDFAQDMLRNSKEVSQNAHAQKQQRDPIDSGRRLPIGNFLTVDDYKSSKQHKLLF